MKATEQLKAEHEGIRMMLSILDRICLKLESGEQVDVNHLEQIWNFSEYSWTAAITVKRRTSFSRHWRAQECPKREAQSVKCLRNTTTAGAT